MIHATLFNRRVRAYWPSLIVMAALSLAGFHSLRQVDVGGAFTHTSLPPWPLSSNPDLWPALDRMLDRLPLDPDGQVRLDGRTAAALQRAMDAITQPLVPAEKQRIQLLMERALPTTVEQGLTEPPIAERVYRLFLDFLAYQEALTSILDDTNLDARRQSQHHHFGEAAEALFHDENLMLELILGSGEAAANETLKAGS